MNPTCCIQRLDESACVLLNAKVLGKVMNIFLLF